MQAIETAMINCRVIVPTPLFRKILNTILQNAAADKPRYPQPAQNAALKISSTATQIWEQAGGW
jgi:hypothetical protein